MTQPLKNTATVVYIAPQRLKEEQELRDISQNKVEPSNLNPETALAKAWRVRGR
jgi:hypothetical protein